MAISRQKEARSRDYALLSSYRMTSVVLYCAQYHRQSCTLEHFGILYMYNLDDKHPTRPGFEPSTSEFRATTGSNVSSASATTFKGLNGKLIPITRDYIKITLRWRTELVLWQSLGIWKEKPLSSICAALAFVPWWDTGFEGCDAFLLSSFHGVMYGFLHTPLSSTCIYFFFHSYIPHLGERPNE